MLLPGLGGSMLVPRAKGKEARVHVCSSFPSLSLLPGTCSFLPDPVHSVGVRNGLASAFLAANLKPVSPL